MSQAPRCQHGEPERGLHCPECRKLSGAKGSCVPHSTSSALGDRIFSIIRRHIGSENAIDPRDIAEQLGHPPTFERQVRRVIAAEYREWPEIVCSKLRGRGDIGGYFIGVTYQEIEAYWAHLYDLGQTGVNKASDFAEFARSKGINLKFAEQAA